MTTLEELFTRRIAVIVPDAIGAGLAAEVRARLERTGYRRYGLIDRGSYDLVDAPHEPELLVTLTRLATKATGRALAVAEARAIRLGAGDYLLAHHDRIQEGSVELMLDLSPAGVPGAEVHYRDRGRVVFRVASVPGALSVVERSADVTCNHTYVSKLHTGAAIVRLVVQLHDQT